jgi:hypothetical protein
MLVEIRSVNGVPIRLTEEGERYGPGSRMAGQRFRPHLACGPWACPLSGQASVDRFRCGSGCSVPQFLQAAARATDSELRDDGIIVHRRGKKVVGLTIQDASMR